MRVDVSDFRALAARQRDVQARLLRNVEQAAQDAAGPVDREVAESARSTLPGGLADFVAAASVDVSPERRGDGAGVEITAKRTNSRGGQVDLAGIDAGTVHHRVYGHGLPVAQSVPAGFWRRVMEGPLARRARQELTDALDRTARK